MKRVVVFAASIAAIGALTFCLAASAASADGSVIYDSTQPLPAGGTSFNSQGYECCEVAQLGDAVGFAGKNRVLTQVTVTMDDWAIFSGPADSNPWQGQPTNGNLPALNGATYTNPNGYYVPVTLNLYNISSDPSARWALGSPIASVTQNVLIPWQPSPSSSAACQAVDSQAGIADQAWNSPSQGCIFGYAANITLTLPSPGVLVPDQVAWGLAFNTQTYGSPPTGQSGPYNSLNVALTPSVRTGTDINPGAVFLDGGPYPYGTAGTYNVFRNDCLPGSDGSAYSDNASGCDYWAGYIPAAQFTATQPQDATCTGVLPPGPYKNVTAEAGCVINNADQISGNVTVDTGGTLEDGTPSAGGASIGGNLQANKSAWIDLGHGGSIGGNLQVQGLTSLPSGTGDGATANDLCNTTVGGDVQVQNNGASSPFDIGSAPDCGKGLTIGGNLQVQGNAAQVLIANNSAHGNVQVQKNTGGGSLTSNSAGGNCQLQNDTPPITGSANTAGGKQNSCNASA